MSDGDNKKAIARYWELTMQMAPETKLALEQSIAKWQANFDAKLIEDIRYSAADCPLCVLYRGGPHTYGVYCYGCPVRMSGSDDHDPWTSRQNCYNTPYEDFIACFYDIPYDEGAVVPDHLRELIKEELDFLKSLLPE